MLWADGVQRMVDAGVTVFLEFGAGQVLTSLVQRLSGALQATAIGDARGAGCGTLAGRARSARPGTPGTLAPRSGRTGQDAGGRQRSSTQRGGRVAQDNAQETSTEQPALALAGKVALVTGASGAIGGAIARRLGPPALASCATTTAVRRRPRPPWTTSAPPAATGSW